MEESVANDVVERLQAKRIFAHINRRVGVYSVGVRVVIPDGREAIWDNDGAAGLEAMVLRDGILVGFVPEIPGSEDFDAAAITAAIAEADYDASPAASSPSHPTKGPRTSPVARAAAPVSRRWTDRLRRKR